MGPYFGLLNDFQLNRKPVTVPSRLEPHAVASANARFHDEILENFVDRVPDVCSAVRIGRAIQKNKSKRRSGRTEQQNRLLREMLTIWVVKLPLVETVETTSLCQLRVESRTLGRLNVCGE